MLCSCLILTGLGGLYAQTSDINVVSSAVPFLRVTPDARGGSMGDASIAATADANAIYWNAAKTIFAHSTFHLFLDQKNHNC